LFFWILLSLRDSLRRKVAILEIEYSGLDCAMTISNITELSTQVEKLFISSKSRWWFRGHEDAKNYTLLPKVRRPGYTPEVERYLFYYFYPRASLRYSKCPADNDLAGWLALMQHYGLPTRLLDWTWSPLVAAFFATQDFRLNTSQDGCIWAIEPCRLNKSQRLGAIFPPLNAEMIRPFLEPARYSKAKEKNKIAAATPMETDLRMLVQQGAFTVHSSTKELDQLRGSARWLRKIMIPREYKSRIAKELDILGFRSADLFPNLDNLAKEAMAQYPPRP
jgi:hypothetical protein